MGERERFRVVEVALLTDERRQQVEELFRRYGKGVGSYVLARVGSADVAEQITGTVFLTVVRQLEQCRGSTVAWLWSIVRSEIARYFRDRKDVVPLEIDLPDDRQTPHAKAEQSEQAARLRRAMDRLTEEQRTLVHMKFFLDLRNTEIAEAMGLTATNVGVLSHRAVKRLKELMDEPTEESTATERKTMEPASC